jgi:hypothetical protein
MLNHTGRHPVQQFKHFQGQMMIHDYTFVQVLWNYHFPYTRAYTQMQMTHSICTITMLQITVHATAKRKLTASTKWHTTSQIAMFHAVVALDQFQIVMESSRIFLAVYNLQLLLHKGEILSSIAPKLPASSRHYRRHYHFPQLKMQLPPTLQPHLPPCWDH